VFAASTSHVWSHESHGLDHKARGGDLGPRFVSTLEQPAIQIRQAIKLGLRICGEQNGERFLARSLAGVRRSDHVLYGSAISRSFSLSGGGGYRQGTNYRFHTLHNKTARCKNLSLLRYKIW